MGELDTHLQMEGLLTWWGNAAADDLELACETLQRIGLGDQAALLCEVEAVMPARSLLDANAQDVGAVTSFAERHPRVTDTQYELVASIEPRLWYSDPQVPDVYELLVAHVAASRK